MAAGDGRRPGPSRTCPLCLVRSLHKIRAARPRRRALAAVAQCWRLWRLAPELWASRRAGGSAMRAGGKAGGGAPRVVGKRAPFRSGLQAAP